MYLPQAQVSIEDTNSLRPKNSSLSKDCKEYTDKVISLSQERDDLKAKVTQYEQEIMVSCKYLHITVNTHISVFENFSMFIQAIQNSLFCLNKA